MSLLYLFLLMLIASFGVHYYLAWRQIRYVRAHKNTVPKAFSHHISLSSHQRAANYTVARVQLSMYEHTTSLLVVVALLLLGGLQALDLFWARLLTNEWARQLSLVGSVVLLTSLVQLPFTLWRIFKLEAHFGFNRMRLGLFISDMLKSTLISLLLGVPLLSAVLWLMAHTGSAWPWWVWLCWLSFSLVLLWVFPRFIAPLFNQFKPLERTSLKSRIYTLSQRCGFSLDGLYVMDGSKRSAHGNAYFTGLGKHKRIVFFDTLLNKLNDEEIEAVLAHELGHFKHHHIIQRMVCSFALALGGLLLLAWLSQKVWFYTQLGVLPQLGRANDALALVLFFLCMPIFGFWVGPLFNLWSRHHEYQADAFAAIHSNPRYLVQALIKLYNDNAATLTPDPWYAAYYASHPSALERVQFLKKFYEKN